MIDKDLSIAQVQDELVEEFALFTDWTEKYEHIIAMGKDLAPMDESHKTDDNLIKGCQSRVWLHARIENGLVMYEADSDAMITRGLISMIVRVFTGRTPDEILNSELTFIDRIGLKEHLSPTRSNGLLSMVKQIKLYALAFSAKK